MKKLFGGSAAAETARSGSRTTLQGPRVPRHSSGWIALQQYLAANPGQRILDVGPTSPTNINFLTGLGHSVYMADMVDDANSEEYRLPPLDIDSDDEEPPRYDTARFVIENLDFAGREFDVVLLWDTLDYLPEPFVPAVIGRLQEVLQAGGRLLAFFHTGEQGPETPFNRYHLTAGDSVEAQRGAMHRIHSIYSNRGVEKLFSEFREIRFFLARDKMREVIIQR
jgi:hypothetical protein